jgi:hypothetical protein
MSVTSLISFKCSILQIEFVLHIICALHGFRIGVITDCAMAAKMGESLAEVAKVYQCASECNLHAACPVPMAILKAIEVEAGLALPRPVLIRFDRE